MGKRTASEDIDMRPLKSAKNNNAYGHDTINLAGKDELMMLSTDWLTQLKSLQNCQRPIQNIESELEQIESQLERVFARFSELLTKRTKRILELSKDSSAKDELELDQGEIRKTLESIKEHHVRQMSLRDELGDLMAQSDAVGERLIKAADSQFVSAGLLTREQEEYHSDHTAARQDNSNSSKRRATMRQDNEGFHSGRHNQTSNSVVQDDGPEDILAVLQNESSRDLAEAKRAFSQASKAFHNVRETYDERYEIFQNEVEAGRLRGTKTLFDGLYFLEHNRLNRRLTVAEAQLWAARKDAQRTGALPHALHTSDFADRSDDGHTPQQIEAYVASFDMARIERWRLDGAQKDIELDESKWGQGLPEHEVELASVAALSSTSQDRYD
ncbi:hypothetical protein KC332_g3614 [Hortaea werneckii]|nr:hypothetical protein KC350_g2385 [Hortaea werneckii]KAI6850227.1 hypothetical protein KC358_g810 [Hortaea werneckii]KAI6940785.1 hypothetical protein KC348_g4910 [Hortaea werneckii]KAI6941123.1 hypothetical protein KC341_g3116 [Hortaea werneckii]KAI6978768.1 hypothetical protein KC321_g2720 [Hortaea werneckii]